jgi:hypothetical protein
MKLSRKTRSLLAMKRGRGKQTKLRYERKGQMQNSVVGKKGRKFRRKLQGRNVNFEERKKRSDGGKTQEDRLRYLKR